MIEDAIRYPRSGEAELTRLGIGGLLLAGSPLVVPPVVAAGYLVAVIRSVEADGDAAPPAFGRWESLLVDGAKAVAVAAVYGVAPTALVGLAAVVDGRSLLLGALVGLAASSVGLAAAYSLPAGVALVARTGRLDAAFDPTAVWTVATTVDYAAGWLVAVAASVVAGVVAALLVYTVVGAIAAPFVLFAGLLAAAYAVGRGVGGSRTAA